MTQVSIVTRTRNRAPLLRRAIESVLGQAHTDWEHLIVDASDEPAPAARLVERFAERYGARVRLLRADPDAGPEAAATLGAGQASGALLAFHDDDDSWDPNFLAACVAALAGRLPATVAGAVGHARRVRERVDGDHVTWLAEEPLPPPAVELAHVAAADRIPRIACVLGRDAFARAGGLDPAWGPVADWALHLRLLETHDLVVVPSALARVHLRTEGQRRNRSVEEAATRATWESALRNELVRRDAAAGRVGVGLLAQLATLESPAAAPEPPLVRARKLLLELARDGWKRR